MTLITKVARTVRREAQRYVKNDRLYQDFWYRDRHYIGSKNTTAQFHALDIGAEIGGNSFLDLGCNVGGLVFLAEQAGASSCVGVEMNPELHKKALQIAAENVSQARFILGNILAYRPDTQFDIVTCMAVVRHIFAQIAEQHVPGFKQPARFLENNSMDVLFRHRGDFPAQVYMDYDATIAKLMSLARRRFIFSLRDQSGLIARRGQEIETYLRQLDDRVQDVELFILDRTMPYVAISVRLI